MKPVRYAIYLIAFVMCSCAREKDFPNAHPYPFLQILDAAADSTGIKVAAEISTPGTVEVKEYGFAYHPSAEPQKEEVRIKVPVKGNKLEILLTDHFLKHSTYQIRVYAIADNKIVYSPAVTLKSLISSKPVITDFFPKEGAAYTEVTITGTSFTNTWNPVFRYYSGQKGRLCYRQVLIK